MKRIGAMAAFLVAFMAAAGPAVAQTSDTYARHIGALNARMHGMLQNVARQNAQADNQMNGNLPTIVRLRLNPYLRQQLRADMTDRTERYINAHWGDCRANTTMYALNAPAPNPSNSNVSQTFVDFPLSTLLGGGNLVQTTYANGVVDQCGR